jgi:hypothetical protein
MRQHSPIRSISIVVGLLIVCLNPAFAQSPPPVSFSAARSFDAGAAPSSVAVGDFNGDGKPGLAVVNQGGVSVLLGSGNGTFQTPVNYTAVQRMFCDSRRHAKNPGSCQ